MEQLIATFRPITLEEMSTVKLMNRIDTKFVTTMPTLVRLLEMARPLYRLQDLDGERNPEYRTTYYDTADFAMYREHQHDRANRQKLRYRTYVSSGLQFLEVKTKNNHGRTKKRRIEVDAARLADPRQLDFARSLLHHDTATLRATLSNRFHRLTLVNEECTERLTVDTDLSFSNPISGRQHHMGPLAIVELKRDGLCPSPVLAMLLALRIFPHGFSKYCMGSALTNPALPVNRFKPKLIDIRKLAARA